MGRQLFPVLIGFSCWLCLGGLRSIHQFPLCSPQRLSLPAHCLLLQWLHSSNRSVNVECSFLGNTSHSTTRFVLWALHSWIKWVSLMRPTSRLTCFGSLHCCLPSRGAADQRTSSLDCLKLDLACSLLKHFHHYFSQ